VTSTTTTCGGACIGTGQSNCPINHTCSNNKCVFNSCLQTGITCAADQCSVVTTPTPQPQPQVSCGGSCTTNANCPGNHTCSAGKCVLNSCIGNAACTNNGCTLPQTAVISDSLDGIIFGFLFIILGLLAYRTNFGSSFTAKLLFRSSSAISKTSGILQDTIMPEEVKRDRNLEKSFEKKINDNK
jgi:hypothetical protein